MGLRPYFCGGASQPALVETAEYANTNTFDGNEFHVEVPISAFANNLKRFPWVTRSPPSEIPNC